MVSEFQLPLRRPLRTSYGAITHRRGVLLRLADNNGQVGWGQSMPLPHQPAEVLSAELEHWAAQPGLPQTWSNLPYSKTAFSLALADLNAKQAGLPLYRWLLSQDSLPNSSQTAANPLAPTVLLPLNALISADSCRAVAEAGSLAVQAGYRAVKLKVGSAAWSDDLKRIASLRQAIGNQARLRLDANGAWDVSTAQANLNQLAAWDIDYIEEPTSGLAALAELAAVSPVAIAVDESIRDRSDLNRALAIFQKADLAALIIKPTVLGDLVGLWRDLQAAAAELRLRLVISSALDSSLGIAAAGHVAAALAQLKPLEPCGLDTARLLAADLCDATKLGDPDSPNGPDSPNDSDSPNGSNRLNDSDGPNDPDSPLPVVAGQLALPPGPGLGLEPSTEALKHLTTQITRGKHHV